MRARLVEKNILYNRRLLRCGFFASTLFQRLILVVDDCGRFYGDTASIRAAVFPMVEEITEQMIGEALLALSREGVVQLYEVRGERYLCLTGWNEHQSLRYKTPVYPAPESPHAINNNIISTSEEEKRSEEKGSEEKRRDALPPLSPPAALPEGEGGGEEAHRAAPSVRESECDRSDRFETFWAAYPRQQHKHEARRIFEMLRVDDALLSRIIGGIGQWRESEEWTREGGRFVPSPVTFLRGRRWEDVPPRASPTRSASGQVGSFDTDDFFAAALKREFHTRRDD